MCRVLFCFVFQFEECQTAHNTHDEENKLILWKLMHASPVSERDWTKLKARPHSVELRLFWFINKRHKNVRLHMTCVVAKTCMSNVCAWVYVYVFCDVDSGGCYLQRYALRLLYTVVYIAIPAMENSVRRPHSVRVHRLLAFFRMAAVIFMCIRCYSVKM